MAATAPPSWSHSKQDREGQGGPVNAPPMTLLSSEGKAFPEAPPGTPPPQHTSLPSHWQELDHMTPPAAREAGSISDLPQPLEWEMSK